MGEVNFEVDYSVNDEKDWGEGRRKPSDSGMVEKKSDDYKPLPELQIVPTNTPQSTEERLPPILIRPDLKPTKDKELPN